MAEKSNFLETIGFGTILGSVALITVPFAYIVRGLALSHIWRWFLVDLGFPQISIARAIGISITFSLISAKTKSLKPKNKQEVDPVENMSYIFGQMILGPMLSLALGYCVHLFL